MLCRVIQYSLLSNPCRKAWLNIQKSAQAVVPKKSMKVDGGKSLTVLLNEKEKVMDIWDEMYKEAKEKLNPRVISPFIEAGGVAAAILTDKGNIYTGVCIDTSCTLGMCAERNAIANMITNGESKIVKLVCVMGDGSVGSPCGACREYLMQLDKESPSMEILVDYKEKATITLNELIPDWWGKGQMNANCDL